MKKTKTLILFLTALFLICLAAPGWSYTIELFYGALSNRADAETRRTSTSTVETDIPGPISSSSSITQTASNPTTSPPFMAFGTGTARPAVKLDDLNLDCNYWVLSAYANSGKTEGTFYEAYSQGFGNTLFRFRITSVSGIPTPVPVALGFRIEGTYDLAQGSTFNYVSLIQYGAEVSDATFSFNEVILDSDAKFSTAGSGSYTDGNKQVYSLLTDTFYNYEGWLQVDASAYGYNFTGNNIGDFTGSACIEVVPLPGGLVLLGGGLLRLVAFYRRQS